MSSYAKLSEESQAIIDAYWPAGTVDRRHSRFQYVMDRLQAALIERWIPHMDGETRTRAADTLAMLERRMAGGHDD
jgi:hypothetical protein